MEKGSKWFKPIFDVIENETPKKGKMDKSKEKQSLNNKKVLITNCSDNLETPIINHNNWMKNFDPVKVEDLAVHNKKIQEVEEWIKSALNNTCHMLLLTGPVGCGKTATIQTLAAKYGVKISEWITPLDVDLPTDYGEYEFKEKQSKKFLDFIINAANFTSLLDNNTNKLVLVEDFPNTFMRTPSEFANVLDFNSVSVTGLRTALKRASEIISKKYSTMYNIPLTDTIESVVNSSAGDVRSAILNLHFASLKGINHSLETSIIKENKAKGKTRKRKPTNKFMSLGKDQTVSILHGVGRVLNPKVLLDARERSTLTHSPEEIVDQFLSSPSSFINFLEENYLPHFSCINDVDEAASALSEADYMLSEWREKFCQEYGLYIAVAGLMLSNKSPLSAWNPVRGPKNMKIQYPTVQQLPLLDKNYMYKGKVIVTDYLTYCKIIGNKREGCDESLSNEDELIIE